MKLYYGPGACSFVPHVGLEAIKAATGEDFGTQALRLHKGEQHAPEYLALNPLGLVPVLVVDGKPLSQIVAICDDLASLPAYRTYIERLAAVPPVAAAIAREGIKLDTYQRK